MEEGTIFKAQDAPVGNTPPVGIPASPPTPINTAPVQPLPSQPKPPDPIGSQFPTPPSAAPPPIPVDHGAGEFSKFPLKKIFKIFLGLLVILGILFVIFALLAPRLRGEKSTGLVTITYWGLWEDQNVMNSITSDFEKENPNIKIEYSKEDPKNYREKLNARIENGTGPDIFRFHNTWYPMLSGVLLPLPKETIEKQEFADKYYKVAKEDLIKNGAIYGIPLEIDTLSLFVSTDLFDSASKEQGTVINVPTTWQEFIDSSAKLTKRDENEKIIIAGAGLGVFENVLHAPDIISLLFVQNGVDMKDITKSGTKILDALIFYTNFSLVENNVWDSTLDNSLQAFAGGKLAMFFGYSWDYFAIKALNPNLNFKVVPVPQLLSTEKVNIASYWAEGVSAKTKHQKEALLFMKFLAKPETQEKLYAEESKTRLFGEPYSNKNLAEKLKNTDSFIFVDQANTAVSSPFVSGTFDNGLNDKLNNYLKDAVNGILGNTSDETSLDGLFKGYSQVLGQYATAPSQ
ncbi:MAG: sugar ABC transporter substrate-binding protein [Patescibacteria group bacterium]